MYTVFSKPFIMLAWGGSALVGGVSPEERH
jgi:hypothetical protein